MDNIVFGPLTIPRHVMDRGMDPYRCQECTRPVKEGDRYGWIDDGSVCGPCADRLEAAHR
jgi:hypothetical protein